jgi:hypothetical protein
VKNPTIVAVRNPIIILTQPIPLLPSDTILSRLKIPAPKIIGVANKNENRVAASLFMPENKPALIVIPDRETPGIIAKA